jgi:hypothetical protein
MQIVFDYLTGVMYIADMGGAMHKRKPKMFVSFSAGRTSGRMTNKLLEEGYAEEFDLIFGFANTGQENEKSLVFADRCDKEWGLNLVWLEAVTHPGRLGCTHRVVTFETASRNGEPFEQMIQKYGIPNKAYPHCTRELKINPILSYLKSQGWKKGAYLRAIGIRADEPKRIRKDAKAEGIIYPLVSPFPMTKPEINEWWAAQSFDLGLEEHQGNCTWCWKKSLRKHVKLYQESPEIFQFPAQMEEKYGLAGHNVDGNPRVFFRSNTSTKGLIQIAQSSAEIRIPSDDPDADSGCSESCEVFA